MIFKTACKKDIPQLTKLRVEFLKEDFKNIPDDELEILEKNITKYFKKHLNKDAVSFIALDGKNIVATAMLLIIEKPANPNFVYGKVGSVHGVYTLPEYRRQGLALQLIKNLVTYSKENKIDRVELKASKMGAPVYEKAGFELEHDVHQPMVYRMQG